MASLGANQSSGRTDTLITNTIYCGIPSQAARAQADLCCKSTSGQPAQPAQLSSTYLESQICSNIPTPAQFALYPKVATTQSVYTYNKLVNNCATLPEATARFQQFQRYQPAVPCAPLPIAAYLAGRSLPSQACLYNFPGN
jgi:hypothetical protein